MGVVGVVALITLAILTRTHARTHHHPCRNTPCPRNSTLTLTQSYAFETKDLLRNVTGKDPKKLLEFFTEHRVRFTQQEGEELEELVHPRPIEELKKPRAAELGTHKDTLTMAVRQLKQLRLTISDVIEELTDELGR